VQVRTTYKEEKYNAKKRVEKLEEENRSLVVRIQAFERQFNELNERKAAEDGLAGLGDSIDFTGIDLDKSSMSEDEDEEVSSQVHSEITFDNLDDPSGNGGSDEIDHPLAETKVSSSIVQLDAAYVTQLRNQVIRGKATIEKLDQRLAALKKSAEETEKSLREEIDTLKKEREGIKAHLSAELNMELDELRTKLQCRETTISSLEISKENRVVELEEKIAALENRGEGSAEKTVEAGLERVASIQKHTGETIELLSALLTRLKKEQHNDAARADGIKVASDLAEKVVLVQREAEVSLQLVELGLKNKIESMKAEMEGDGATATDSAGQHRAGVMDSSNIQRMAAISALERETKGSLREIQSDFMRQMEGIRDDLESLKSLIESKEEEIRSLEVKARFHSEAQQTCEQLRSEAELSADRLKEKDKTVQELMSLVEKYKAKNEERSKRYEKAKRKAQSLERDVKSALERIEEQDQTIRILRDGNR